MKLAAALIAVGLICLAYRALAAEHPRMWVLWDETQNTAWTTAKGHTATSTSATACSLASVEATRSAPSGTRFSCRRIGK